MAALILVALIPRAFLQQQQRPSSVQRAKHFTPGVRHLGTHCKCDKIELHFLSQFLML